MTLVVSILLFHLIILVVLASLFWVLFPDNLPSDLLFVVKIEKDDSQDEIPLSDQQDQP